MHTQTPEQTLQSLPQASLAGEGLQPLDVNKAGRRESAEAATEAGVKGQADAAKANETQDINARDGAARLEKLLLRATSFRAKGENVSELDEYFKGLLEKSSAIKDIISKDAALAGSLTGREVLSAIRVVEENLDFTSQFKNVFYMQLPLNINDNSAPGELYVFKDARNANKKTGSGQGSASALLALDLAYLGHLEAYVHRKGSTVSCQFRIEDGNIEKMMRGSMPKLERLLRNKGFHLALTQFKKTDEKFTLLDAPPSLTDDAQPKQEMKLSIDIRT